MGLVKKWLRKTARSPVKCRAQLNLEALESRLVPYAVSGSAWPHAQVISLSFVPDGTDLGGVPSNLFATFNAEFGSTYAWQHQIIRAAEQWARNANINFTVIGDNGSPIGGGSFEQGDPGMGDIRIGGYNFGAPEIAAAYFPPQTNNFSIAGDLQFNTAQPFCVGGSCSSYDIFTVAMHEIGHALGMLHSSSSQAAMFGAYTGPRTGLSCDDIAGIQGIYGSPKADPFEPNSSFSAAANVTGLISPTSLIGQLTTLNIATPSEADYFSFTAPAATTGTLTLTVQSSGLSLLRPAASVYNANLVQLASAAGTGDLGSTVTLKASVTPGQVYYVVISGADRTAWGTGAYAVGLNLGAGQSPPLPLPNTMTLYGYPLVSGGGSPLLPTDGRESDGPGRDGFSVNEGRSQSSVVSSQLPVAAAPTTIAAPAASIGVVVSQAPVSRFSVVSSQLSVVSPRSAAPAEARVESGGGTSVALQLDEMDPATLPDRAAPATQSGEEGLDAVHLNAADWREACTACFADSDVSKLMKGLDNTSPAFDSGSGTAVDPAAALAGIAVVFGAYWSARPEQSRSRLRPGNAGRQG
jgi:hypothetical protein